MLEKLTEDYDRTVKMGNGGHRIGYYREKKDEMVYGRYEFPLGVYTVHLVTRHYFDWKYDIKEEEEKRE